jgi:hypothetical protein
MGRRSKFDLKGNGGTSREENRVNILLLHLQHSNVDWLEIDSSLGHDGACPSRCLQIRQRGPKNAGKILRCLAASLQHFAVAERR